MSQNDTMPVIRYLNATLGNEQSALDDSELLERFTRQRDPLAFELLIWRHGRLVQGVCRSILNDRHLAEDAMQAAFLVLARKAGTLHGNGSIAGWLFLVARRIAFRMQANRQKLKLQSLSGTSDSAGPEAPNGDDETRRIVREEIGRLSERYRTPVLLCYFEGLSHAEAARRIGVPIGTIAGRVSRARDLLERRLSRRGVTASLAAIATTTFTADLSAGRIPHTINAAIATVGRQSPVPFVSPDVARITEGAIHAMFMNSLQKVAASAIAIGLLTTGIVTLVPGEPREVAGQSRSDAKPIEPTTETPIRNADAAQRARSVRNLKDIMIGVHNFFDALTYLPSNIYDAEAKPLLSWRVAILPYIGEGKLYSEFRLNEPWDSEHNLKLLGKIPKIYQTGIEPKDSAHTYYQVFHGIGTPWYVTGPTRAIGSGAEMGGATGGGSAGGGEGGGGSPGGPPSVDRPIEKKGADYVDPKQKAPLVRKIPITFVEDGASNTVGVIEAGPPVPWTKPADIDFDPSKPLPKFNGPFGNVFQVSMMDGSVFSMKCNIDPRAMKQLIMMNDGEILSVPFHKLQAMFLDIDGTLPERLHKAAELLKKDLGRIAVLQRELLELQEQKLRNATTIEQLEMLSLEYQELIETLKQKKVQPAPKSGTIKK